MEATSSIAGDIAAPPTSSSAQDIVTSIVSTIPIPSSSSTPSSTASDNAGLDRSKLIAIIVVGDVILLALFIFIIVLVVRYVKRRRERLVKIAIYSHDVHQVYQRMEDGSLGRAEQAKGEAIMMADRSGSNHSNMSNHSSNINNNSSININSSANPTSTTTTSSALPPQDSLDTKPTSITLPSRAAGQKPKSQPQLQPSSTFPPHLRPAATITAMDQEQDVHVFRGPTERRTRPTSYFEDGSAASAVARADELGRQPTGYNGGRANTRRGGLGTGVSVEPLQDPELGERN
ncbi:hypothetical protein HDU97_008868 [Phlyctochytrium planicorne]|nr:hypothetical protein HDU97_008868 [Phlyctochytrium planicorne]